MIRFVSKWFGLDELSAEEFAALRRPAEIAITKATLYFEGKVKKKLSAVPPRTGRMYWTHQASAPGEPPAPLTGELRRSISHTDVTWNENYEASAEVGTPLARGRILEFGGVAGNGARILPRPYFGATWLEEEAKMQAILDKAVSTKAPVLADIEPEVVG